MPRKRNIPKIVTQAVVIPILVLVGFMLILTWALGGFHENVARDAVAPLTAELDAAGGHRLCDEGDAGYGPDNSQPWYKVFYEVPSAHSARATFFAAASSHHLALSSDTSVRGQSVHQRFFRSQSAGDSDAGLTLVVHRDVTVQMDCSSGWATTAKTSGSDAVYEIEFASPRR